MGLLARAKVATQPLRAAYHEAEARLYGRGVLSSARLCLPDFLGIGAAQAGTTWLYANLCMHPGVYMPATKELHYFDRNFRSGIRNYANNFTGGSNKVKGEITPGYGIIVPERIRFVRSIMPKVRLIFVMRNPIDRAWSAARRVLSREAARSGKGFEDLEDTEFYEYFCKEHEYKPERGMGGDFEPGLLRGHYSAIIANWLKEFHEEQLFTCFFEQIKHSPKELLSDVFSHIGVSQTVDWNALPFTQVVNRNPEHPIPERFHKFLAAMYRDEIERLYERFGDSVAAWRC